ncbi:MAG: hypothetical protein UX80_C0009G0047 [Candidatus Amesbacteria bacterium GW2011_GWA2_47_11b]|uniref:Transposase IS200-like domain-containing protein n=3 Tax=Candidatus Amesiibacteriota TaxID=1752730 RepID=A0A0G1VC42_9BACT|nr:MAG: hypothetical protein UX42_C0006G0013 [Microgenomates group bacterium GW2011_GWC1_46_20]KKU57832.1 MAG: hypothetical protein UX80_C0009G0047 [Candidatus Amesbacteria bacterium GW2011_GWA2_47_11b]KKU67585.1 MAG: hypothetical protein UX92_C0030G0013 [Candidatus Amesbacteria bacterium GW2011_GWA1_47_20]KKU82722.1 MAG: hypothetical protein UY11_C0040G0004 [Candidatus Amesbacteria bacterium GW2011_GWC2_47_8]
MPYRQTVFTNGEYYHLTTRSIGENTAFPSTDDYSRAIEIINYYSRSSVPIRYSYFRRLSSKSQADLFASLKNFRVQIICFCLMPTHYHFIVKQSQDHGINHFIHDFQDSYVKYFNNLNSRHGALFQASFRAVHITSEEQFLHTCRYVHLNPYSSNLVKNYDGLTTYPWSSLPHYLNKINYPFISEDTASKMFKDRSIFLSFTLDHAQYQKTLEFLKHHTPGV